MQELVPVQLNLGSSHGTDWLLWPVGALEEVPDFAAGLLQDLGVPPQFHRPVAESILGQVSEWVGSVPQPPPPPVPEQRRELVRLDVVLGGTLRLRDQFLWDLHAASPTPEEFAAELCADCGLEARYGTEVAVAIRVELAKLRRKAASNVPLPTPRIFEHSLRAHAAAAAEADGLAQDTVASPPPLQSVYGSSCTRAPEAWQEWGPALNELSQEEMAALQQQRAAALARQQQALAQRIQQQNAAAAQHAAAAQQAAMAAQGAPAASAQQAQQQQQQQQPQVQQQVQQPQGKKLPAQQQGRKRQQGGDEQPAVVTRTLRPRRATRLAALLKEEEESDHSSSSGGGGGGGSSKEGSKNTGAAAAGAGVGAGAAHRGGGAGASAGSGEYRPDEEEQEELAGAAEDAKVHRTRQAQHARQRALRGKKAAAAAASPAAPAAPAAAPALGPPRPGLAAFQQAPQMTLAPGAALPGMLNGAGGSLGVPYGSSRVGPFVLAPAGSQDLSAQQQQQVQMVAAGIVHYARELGIGEHKIQSFLTRPPSEQLPLYRTLHQLVQQARARQQEQLAAAARVQGGPPQVLPPMPPQQAQPPPLPVLTREQLAQPLSAAAGQYANLFSEMFD